MKKLLFMMICMLVIIPTMASAHTHLATSNPKEGAVVTEELSAITLDYEGPIESLSTMKLLNEGKEIPLSGVSVQNKQMVGTLAQPLENGTYEIDWNIVGEDGHTISGKIPFTVQVEQAVEENETPATEVEEDQQEIEQQNEVQNKEEVQETEEPSTNNATTIITVLIVVILAIGLVMLFKKKRK